MPRAFDINVLRCPTERVIALTSVQGTGGGTDATSEICDQLSARMPLSYVRIDHRGLSAAKNAGLAIPSGSIVLFFDDDDVAGERLLFEHLRTHDEHQEGNVAVLGYTT